MHKGHMTGCVIAIGAALILATTTGGSIGGLGLLLAILICPITMGAAMWFLTGSQRKAGPSPAAEVMPEKPALDVPPAPR